MQSPPKADAHEGGGRIQWAKVDEVAQQRAEPERGIVIVSFHPSQIASPTHLQKWFLEGIMQGKGQCAECGLRLNYRDRDTAFGSQAHILPQAHFKSVQTHPANRLELGRWCCHQTYDSSWESASRMKVWPKAKRIMITILIPLLPAYEYRRLPASVREEYEKTNR